MKKKQSIILVLALILSMALSACGQKASDAKPAQEATDAKEEKKEEAPAVVGGSSVVNPMTERESLEEVNSLTGGNLMSPGVMGKSDEKFFTYDLGDYVMGEYVFKVNGYEFTFRNALTTAKDISGVYIGGNPAFGEASDAIEYAYDGDVKVARWFTMDGQYTLFTEAKDYDKERFEMIAEELAMTVDPAMSEDELSAYYDSLAGDYSDSFSQRAVLHAEKTEGGLAVEVDWSSSAFEYTSWKMTLVLSEDSLLYYTDCVKANHKTDEKGNDTEEVEFEEGEGFFSEMDGILYWNGSPEESCGDCAFEKAE